MKVYLIYSGRGFLAGVPARNLSEKESKRYGIKRLVESGLYEKARQKSNKPAPTEKKVILGGSENKSKE